MPHSVMVIDDDPMILQVLEQGLRREGYDVEAVGGGAAAISRLDQRGFDCLLVDLLMPEVDGFEVMRWALAHNRARAVVVITGQKSIPVAVEAMRAGAKDFITKPFEPAAILGALERALGSPKAVAEQREVLRAWRTRFAPEIVGESPKLLEVLDVVARIADTDCNVLITGASGTGKELVARSIHRSSARGSAAFVAVNCVAIPKDLMESEMFGHARGAFTGATERRDGRFQVADGGTLFLDEIGEMELSMQAKLLRAIQEKEFTPVGESRVRNADVRIVAATNQDLEGRCRQRLFREDLYFRLNVLPIHLPALAARREDIPLLANHFAARASERHARPVKGFDEDALAALKSFPWPGNVRELANVVERIVILKREGVITVDDLPQLMTMPRPGEDLDRITLPEEGLDINAAMQRVETRLTLDALRRSNGNKAKAAELLGLKRTTLIERLRRLNIPDPET